MSPSFQADYDFNYEIVSGLRRREPTIDFQSAHDAGLEGLADPVVLAIAASSGRILVTHDRNTMPKHFAAFIEHSTSAGVIVIPQFVEIGRAIDALTLIWAASDAEEWRNSITYVSR